MTGTYHPTQACRPSTDFAECTRNWGQWASQEACCAPGAAFADGCSKPEPCWVASAFWPARACGLTDDQGLCQRGWGAFTSEGACCAAGAAFSDGCGPVVGAPLEVDA